MLKNSKFAPDLTKGQDRTIPIRCGKCEGCLKSKINDWAFRLEQEGKNSLHVHFVTLTYSPEFVPLTKQLLQSITKRDIQLYMKRLRKLQPHQNVKYFACGEYGSKTQRPHYHLILFNVDDEKHIENAWTQDDIAIGNCHIINDISNGAIPYTLKYMYKKGLVPAFQTDDREPEFRLMSQKLGLSYLTPAMIKYHLADPKNRMTVKMQNGINVAMPRYFRERLIKISGRARSVFQPEYESVFLTHENTDNLESQIGRTKLIQKNFNRSREQQNRSKI